MPYSRSAVIQKYQKQNTSKKKKKKKKRKQTRSYILLHYAAHSIHHASPTPKTSTRNNIIGTSIARAPRMNGFAAERRSHAAKHPSGNPTKRRTGARASTRDFRELQILPKSRPASATAATMIPHSRRPCHDYATRKIIS